MLLYKPVPNETFWFITPCQALLCLVGIPLARTTESVVSLLGEFFNKFLLESLILAQDERWRRA